MWLAADDHPDFEKTFDIGFDLPALIVVDYKKRAYGRPDGRFGKDTINRYLDGLFYNKFKLESWPRSFTFSTVQGWQAEYNVTDL